MRVVMVGFMVFMLATLADSGTIIYWEMRPKRDLVGEGNHFNQARWQESPLAE